MNENKSSKNDKNDLTPTSFLRPEFLIGDLLRGKKLPARVNRLFAPLKKYAYLIIVILVVTFLINGFDKTVTWLKQSTLDIAVAAIIGLIIFLIVRKR